MLAWLFDECREGQIPAACCGVFDYACEYIKWQVDEPIFFQLCGDVIATWKQGASIDL